MKFGVICYKRPVRPGSGVNINIGDPIQEMAVLNLYREMGIDSKDICFIDRYHMKHYNGDYVLLPMCSFNQISNMYGYEYDSLPPSDKIIPVYISFHLHTRVLPLELVEHLKEHEPIGCRDEETMLNLQNHGIKTWLSGCITVTFPRRKELHNKSKLKNFFVDIPDFLNDFIPPDLKINAEYLEHMPSYHRLNDTHYLTDEEVRDVFDIAKRRLIKYAEEAKLVVTSRLHAASPCMAMGIPVILVRNDISGRFSWIDKFLPIYSGDNFSEIDWHPEPINYETVKAKIIKTFKKLILEKYNQTNCLYEISEFYENRIKNDYNSVLERTLKFELGNLGDTEEFGYAVWGLTDITEVVINVMSDIFPKAKLMFAVDKYVTGQFYGVNIQTPEDIINIDKDIIYIVTAAAAYKDASELLEKEGMKYILLKI